ncbi:Uncharacterised protein [Akkermansia muciniphila]|uniref:Uncharacterized protein n=1 Tax=Akkermansia muciniphila TaxID=239935 RepID=A0A6N2RR00_9BACT|nr:MAG TPA: hypothetical protein [Caudoviricetes sp.]
MLTVLELSNSKYFSMNLCAWASVTVSRGISCLGPRKSRKHRIAFP